MATFNPRKFTDPGWLRTISPSRLIAFFTPWRSYLATRGLTLPTTGASEVEYEKLAEILMAPNTSMPTAMIDALFYIQETSSDEDLEALQVKVAAKNLAIKYDPQATATDYAIDVWLADAHVVQERHAEALARRQQNFMYYAGLRGRPRKFPVIPDATRQAIEAAFDDWFAEHKRGRGSKLLIFHHSPFVWILVRHGKSMHREASHKDDGSSQTEFYRPQHHDVLIYDEDHDELGVNAGTKGERELYLRVLGAHLFGNQDYFPAVPKYTLQPLVDDGEQALACADIQGIEDVKLIEYRQYWGGEFKEAETRRATDIFGALKGRGATAVLTGTLSVAVFRIKFADSPRERRLVIRTPASAKYERNADSELVEAWMRARGFMLPRPDKAGDDSDDDPDALAGAG